MNPDIHQSLVDLLDKELTGSRQQDPSGTLKAGSLSPEEEAAAGHDPSANEDSEIARERRILGVAIEAIRFNAVSEEVKAVMQNIRKEKNTERQLTGTPVKPIHADIDNQPAKGAIVRRLSISSRRIAVVAVFAICLGGAAKYLFTTPSGVFDEYYSSYTLANTRSGDGLSTLERAYQDKDWASVMHDFQFTRSKNGKDYFLTGMAYMEQK